jgi:hypothetical protein
MLALITVVAPVRVIVILEVVVTLGQPWDQLGIAIVPTAIVAGRFAVVLLGPIKAVARAVAL